VKYDHPLHACPVDQEREIVARSFNRRRIVVLRDGAAYDDTSMPGQLRKDNVEDFTADIVEIHVDAVGAVGAEGLANVLALVVDRRIEPEFIDNIPALRGAASDPDTAATFDLGDLADRCADRAGGGGDDDGVALFWVAHIQQAEIGGHAGHAKRIEKGW